MVSPMPWQEQASDADRAFHMTLAGQTRLGHAQVQGVIAAFGHQLVGLHGQGNVGGFEA